MKNINPIAINRLTDHEGVRIDWYIGKRCNYDCSYCGDFLHDNFSSHKSLPILKSVIDNITSSISPESIRIGFTGGEPTVNPNLVDFCKYLKNIGIPFVAITSNGTRTVDYYKDLLKYISTITFSQHYEFSNTEEFIHKIREISASNPEITVQIMFNANYFHEAQKSVKFYKENKIQYTLRRIREVTSSSTAHLYTDEQLEWFFSEQQTEISKNNAIVFYKNKDDIETKELHVNEISGAVKNKFKGWTCWAGIYTLTVWNDDMLYRGSCREGGPINSIYDADINLPTSPVVCTKETCVCAPEIIVKKIKNTNEFNF